MVNYRANAVNIIQRANAVGAEAVLYPALLVNSACHTADCTVTVDAKDFLSTEKQNIYGKDNNNHPPEKMMVFWLQHCLHRYGNDFKIPFIPSGKQPYQLFFFVLCILAFGIETVV